METKYFDLRETHRPGSERETVIAQAAEILRQGGLLAFPTETVYGLGANGLDAEAVRKIFEAKGRPQDNPLILHVPSAQWLSRYCWEVPLMAYELARRFWPGPLTMVLRRKTIVPDVTTAGLDTVAVRCPDHPVAQALIREAGVPVAAPSANRSGRPSCTCAEDVREDMDGRIDGIVDGGPCAVGVESTILDLTCDPPRLLRPGGLPLEDLEAVLGHVEIDRAVVAPLKAGEQPKAPGMKYRHYAPKAPVTVVTGSPAASAAEIGRRAKPGDGVICFAEFANGFADCKVESLGPQGDKSTQAQRLFDALRAFDSAPVGQIYAQCPDHRGLGLAINNRLKKAAGFHVLDADCPRVILGLTGGTGAGKTSALRAIQALGGKTIDCDALYYEMLRTDEALRAALRREFGEETFLPDGSLNRPYLGEQAFSRQERLSRLNDIVYAAIVPEVRRRIEEGDCALWGVDAINLLESGLGQLCDRTVAVTSPMELRLRRIMARDGIAESYARLRISAQRTDDYYRERCDETLCNDTATPEEFEKKATRFFEKIIETVKEEKQHGR